MGILGVQGVRGYGGTGVRGDGGTGGRIATASVRTGFAMTHYKECGRAGRRGRRPLRGVQGVRWAGDRKGRPYGRVAWGAVGGRPQGSPLRKGYMGCGRRATARVAPTEGYKGCGTKSAGGVEPRPYEGLQEVTACGGGLLRCIRGAFCSARRYYGPPEPRFGPGRDRR